MRGGVAGLFVEEGGRLRSGVRTLLFFGLFVGFVLLLLPLLRWLGPERPDLDTAIWWGLAATLPPALAASVVAARRFEGFGLATLGLPWSRGGGRYLLAGSAFGVALMVTVLLVLVAAGWLRWRVEGGALGAAALHGGLLTALLLGAALAEELLFRGYPLQALAERNGAPVAVGITSLGFGLVHAGNPGVSPLALANITLAGVLLGLAYWRTYSLWYATGVHAGWNWTMAVAADVSVSGLGLDMPALEPSLRGPELWTGGGFGPEGGLVASVVTAAGIALLWWRGPDRSLEVRALVPLPDR